MSKCPKPWIHMEEMCTEVFDIVIRCHQGCGDDMNCHRTCPLPKCPKMAAKVKGIIQCNIDCGSDDACRDACNAPVRSFRQMCGRLSTSGICHKNCGQDRVCHKQCPRVFPGKAFVKPDFAGMQPQPPPARMASTFRSCQASCAGDADCIEKCPKPFWLGFRKICQEVTWLVLRSIEVGDLLAAPCCFFKFVQSARNVASQVFLNVPGSDAHQ